MFRWAVNFSRVGSRTLADPFGRVQQRHARQFTTGSLQGAPLSWLSVERAQQLAASELNCVHRKKYARQLAAEFGEALLVAVRLALSIRIATRNGGGSQLARGDGCQLVREVVAGSCLVEYEAHSCIQNKGGLQPGARDAPHVGGT